MRSPLTQLYSSILALKNSYPAAGTLFLTASADFRTDSEYHVFAYLARILIEEMKVIAAGVTGHTMAKFTLS